MHDMRFAQYLGYSQTRRATGLFARPNLRKKFLSLFHRVAGATSHQGGKKMYLNARGVQIVETVDTAVASADLDRGDCAQVEELKFFNHEVLREAKRLAFSRLHSRACRLGSRLHSSQRILSKPDDDVHKSPD